MMANNAMNCEETNKECERITDGSTLNTSASTSWRFVKLGEHIDLLTGFPFKSAQYTYDSESINLLRGDNVAQGYLRWEGVKQWALSKSGDFTRYLLKRGDVILAMDRPWIEAGLKYAWVKKHDPPCLLVQRVARLRGINGLLTEYLRYVIADQSFTDYIKPIVTGVSIPHISPSQINAYMFRLPPVELQSKISAILSAYDDLIENNTRRIKLLEEMAQALYREWFVKFRFPGHENVKMVESELGMVPEGWEVKRLADFGNVITGKTPSKAVPENFGSFMPFIKTPDMHGNVFCIQTGDSLSERGASSQKNKTLPPNSLCISCIGTAGIVTITSIKAQTNQQINSIVLNSERFREYLYFALMGLKEVINQYGANGATMVNLNKGKFEALNVICPDTKNISAFHDLISSHFDSIKTLQIKNINLRRTRDLLLPKLISGEVDVENIDVRMPEV
ncbi:MAG: restriction endonuclease subunit S [Candidatus Methanoperedens sp.]|nr:restriction endonuclease subunit S [Candidatus Methanoperedens sp.]